VLGWEPFNIGLSHIHCLLIFSLLASI
jgi:hypothetical protein